ncbi:hypothetical protein NKR19_g2142 [Coniochaeta hoffmannii]|uniref:Uncharacterized protein n=1 Tax=Coniochaeta hoffmannii TaxID=91930 RepID=A0AA38W2L6_9PEZI|nr:hypothetical protein NKR19_g2142 [Coniochaeta hoffmannii]
MATNGDHTNGPVREFRREEGDLVFADIQFYDPPSTVRAGHLLRPSMILRATSRPDHYALVAWSSATAYLYLTDDPQMRVQGQWPATARPVITPNPNVDRHFSNETITVEYVFDRTQTSSSEAGSGLAVQTSPVGLTSAVIFSLS